jgi:hypothetical protein
MIKLTKQFFGHVLPGVIRPLRILWNEIIGFLFLVIAIWFTPTVVRNFRDLSKPDTSATKIFGVFGAAVFVLILAYYGLSSFWRARKISRS